MRSVMRIGKVLAFSLPFALLVPLALAEEGGEARERRERERIEAKERIGHLLKEAEMAWDRGEKDRAQDLKEQARRIREELEGGDREEKERAEARKLDEAKSRVEKLMRQADEAAEKGEGERAEALRREAQEIRKNIERRPDMEQRERRMAAVKEEIEGLLRGADEADERGNKERAENLRRRAMDLKQDLGRREGGERPEGMAPEAAKKKLRGLEEELARAHEKLKVLQREGREEAAREVMQHIAKLTMTIEDFKRGLRQPEGPGREGPRPEAMGPPIGEDIEALRREIKELRGQLERVERLLKDLEKARARQVLPRAPVAPIAPRRERPDKGDRPAPRRVVGDDDDRDDEAEEREDNKDNKGDEAEEHEDDDKDEDRDEDRN